jgi:signal transduction histidine kinase
LAIAQYLIQRHGGAIAVEDRPGGGARFRVSLPLAAAA